VQVLVCADQLHQRVPGGTGAYLRATLEAARSSSAEAEGPSWILYASRPSSKAITDLGSLGFRYSYSHFPQPLAQRIWDLGLDRPKLPVQHYHSFSMGGPAPTSRKNRSFTQSFAVYDLLWESCPEAFPARGVRWHRDRFMRIRDEADHIVTLSKESKDRLLAHGVEEDRVTVIPPGSNHLPPPAMEKATETLKSAGVEGDFLLTVGTLEPRKNLQRIVSAFSEAMGSLGGPMSLVIVGPKGWGDAIRPSKNVYLLGSVPGEVLAALYLRAVALVYVPIEEGFGLPVFEANAACLPVISSAVPSARFDNSLIVDPSDEISIAEGLCRVVLDDKLRSSLVTQGLMVANERRWDDTFRMHQRLFVTLAGGLFG